MLDRSGTEIMVSVNTWLSNIVGWLMIVAGTLTTVWDVLATSYQFIVGLSSVVWLGVGAAVAGLCLVKLGIWLKEPSR